MLPGIALTTQPRKPGATFRELWRTSMRFQLAAPTSTETLRQPAGPFLGRQRGDGRSPADRHIGCTCCRQAPWQHQSTRWFEPAQMTVSPSTGTTAPFTALQCEGNATRSQGVSALTSSEEFSARARPHRSLGQLTPAQAQCGPPTPISLAEHRIRRRAILGGITHEYWAATAA